MWKTSTSSVGFANVLWKQAPSPKFTVSVIMPLLFFPPHICVIYIWMQDKRAGPETLYQAGLHDTWSIEPCISKANIIMNWICVYVCGPTLDCLWRCPKSNTAISRINTPPFSIPRSLEMKRSFFHNHHLRQSIAGGIGYVPAQPLSTQISSDVRRRHPSHTEIALNGRKNVHHSGADQKWHWPPSPTDSTNPPAQQPCLL